MNKLRMKWWSARYWGYIFKHVPKYLFSPAVSWFDKLLFFIPVLLYWILPDVLPFMPIDDIGITLIAMDWFTRRIDRKYALK